MRKNTTLRKILLHAPLLIGVMVILYFWHRHYLAYKADDVTNLTMELGRLVALVGVYFLMLQILLIGRVSWIERLYGFDRLTVTHHLNGLIVITLLISHPLLITYGYATRDGTGFLWQYRELLTWPSVPAASVGLILLSISAFLSLRAIRSHLRYEHWYIIHLMAYCTVVLAFAHQLKCGNDLIDSKALLYFWYGIYAFSLGNLLIYRFLKPLLNYARHRFTIDRVVQESDDVVSIYITGKDMEKFHYRPGQFIIVCFLAKGFWCEAHPFSISIPPGRGYLRLSIKNSGDFTSRIPRLKPGTGVIIDGPHGIFTPDSCSQDKVLLIAGGIGITPVRALAEDFIKTGKDVKLLYGTRLKGGIVFKGELDPMSTDRNFSLFYIVSGEPAWEGEKGRIDTEKIARLVPDVSEREVYVCGPPQMMTGLVGKLPSLGMRKNLIHYERFAL